MKLQNNFGHCITIFFLIAVFSTSNAQFKMAGGNPQRTGFVDQEGILTEPEIIWERNLNVSGESATQPIIDDDENVYVTGAPEGGKDKPITKDPRGTFISYDKNGNERWRYDWNWNPTDRNYRGASGMYSIPAITPFNSIIIGFRYGWMRSFNLDDGSIVWEHDFSTDREPFTSSPVIDEKGYAYIHSRNSQILIKIKSKDGEIEWAHRFGDDSRGVVSSPTLSHDENTLYIGRTVDDSYLYSINTNDGTYRWAWSPEVSSGHSFAWGIPVVDKNGDIYIQDEVYTNLYAVKERGRLHEKRWTYKPEQKGDDVPRLMAVDDNTIYSSYFADHPVVFALNLDGTKKWGRKLTEGHSIGGFIVDKDVLYFPLNGTENIYALDKKNGKTLWQKNIGKSNCEFSEGMSITKDGTIYVGTNGTKKHPNNATLVALKGK